MQPNNQASAANTSSASVVPNSHSAAPPTQPQPSQQLPLATQVQIRQPLALRQLDQTTQQLLSQNQPLSPTNQAISAANRQQQSEQRSLNPNASGANGKQTELKGMPQQLVGLTTLEYQVEERSLVQTEQFQIQRNSQPDIATHIDRKGQSQMLQSIDLNHFYLNQIYDDKAADFPFKQAADFQNLNENFAIVKLRIHLPVLMTLEYFELHFNPAHFDIFSKYLKFLRVETVNTHLEQEYLQMQLERDENAQGQNAKNLNNKGFIDRSLQRALLQEESSSLGKPVSKSEGTLSWSEQERGLAKLHLKSGYLDYNKKILELHTSGVSQVVNFVFLYNKKKRPSPDTLKNQNENFKERLFSKTMNLSSEKMGFKNNTSNLNNTNNFLSSNELMPLLNGLDGAVCSGDEDIDELDDEVAMISNKQHQKQASKTQKLKPPTLDDLSISHEEIKIEMISTNLKANNKNQLRNIQSTKQQAAQSKNTKNEGDESEETRNFNTLPRNYSDPAKKQQPVKAQNAALQNPQINNFMQNTGSYNDMEFNSQYINEQANLNSNDMGHLQESTNMQLLSQSEILNFTEQEIFQQEESDEELQCLREMQRLLMKTVQNVKISGFNTNTIPAVTNLAYFMNNSFLLRQKQLADHATEYDFLGGVLMVSFKKLTQAAEQFRKIQCSLLAQVDQLHNRTLNLTNSNTIEQQTQVRVQKLYLKCAILELLACESLSQPNQLNEKLQSIERMVQLAQFKPVAKLSFLPVIPHSDDSFSIMKRVLPHMLKFVVMCLTHKKEIVRISALKLIEFILETKGCSLDLAMVFMLKALLKTYPNPNQYTIQSLQNLSNLNDLKSETQLLSKGMLNPREEENRQLQAQNTLSLNSLKKSDSFSVRGFTQSVQEFFQYEDYRHLDQPDDKQQSKKDQLEEITPFTNLKEPASGFLNAMKNAYNHTLETYISVLSSISSHILHQLFYEVILPNILDSSLLKQKGATQNRSSLDLAAIGGDKSEKIQQQQQQHVQDVKLFSIKIAEKIITICQGDLFLNKAVLEFFINTVVQKPTNSTNSETVLNGIRNLWQSIRSKVFTNYSQRGMRILIEWMVAKMNSISQIAFKNALQSEAENSNQQDPGKEQDMSKLEISDEDSQQLLQLFDMVSMIAGARKNNEAEANALIRIKSEYCLELYTLINSLMTWLDFSVEREDRFPLFKSVYTTIKEVLDNLPPRRNDIDLLQIMDPILNRTKDFLKTNSPSLQMLKFLDIVLRDIKQLGYAQDNPEIQLFFLDMLENFVVSVSYCLHEEVFSVFDKLFTLCSDQITEPVVTKCIAALVDKYTLKNRGHKNSLSLFMKNLLEVSVRQKNSTLEDSEDMDDHISIRSKNNYFDIVCKYCFFKNQDPFPLKEGDPPPRYREDFKSLQDLHEQYVDKLQFFMDLLSQLTEVHVSLFAKFISNPEFASTLLGLLDKGDIALRLKCHEILEIVSNYYIQHCPSKTVYRIQQNNDRSSNAQVVTGAPNQQPAQQDVLEVQFINQERLQLAQVMLKCILKSLEQGETDSYLQFNALILLDFLFQQMLPVPTYQNEQQRERINRAAQPLDRVLDLQSEIINRQTPEFEVTSVSYTLMRVELIFKLWPDVHLALNSPWSNIRSICYGLICSMLKIDVQFLQTLSIPSNPLIGQQYVTKLKTLVIPMLLSLLSSKESESKAGGLNILGSFCGLSYDLTKVKISRNMDFFKKNSQFITTRLWQLVFELQEDWDITIKEASVVLIQLCSPRNAVKYFDKVKRDLQEKRFSHILQSFGQGFNIGDTSSRISSSRNHPDHAIMTNNYIQASLNSMNNADQQRDLGQLSGTERISEIFVNDPLNQMVSSSNIFDRLGDTLRSNPDFNKRHQNVLAQLRSDTLAVSDLNLEDEKANTLDEEIRKLERQEFRQQQQLPGSASIVQNTLLNEEPFEFFVDRYQDEQIQEIISIFRNDFKPPKSLWIEKASANSAAGGNQGVPGGTGPDYYADIYPQAIDQFNQQQAYLQQKQQQEQQQMVNNSPRNRNNSSNLVDAMEDDMVKKLEKEKQEKEKNKLNPPTAQAQEESKAASNGQVDNYKIFERHYEDGKEQEEAKQDQSQQEQKPLPQKQLTIDTNIDAEPFQFLDDSPGKILPINDSPSLHNPHVANPTGAPHSQQIEFQQALSQGVPAKQTTETSGSQKQTKKTKKSKEEKKTKQPVNQLQLQDIADPRNFSQQIPHNNLGPTYQHERTPIATNQQPIQLQPLQAAVAGQSAAYSNLSQQLQSTNASSGILTSKQQQQMMQLDVKLHQAEPKDQINQGVATLKSRKKSTGKEKERNDLDKRTTDELIEEYERKISKTKQKLEEEQRRALRNSQAVGESLEGRGMSDTAAKSTPEFKFKSQKEAGLKGSNILQEDPHLFAQPNQRSADKKKSSGNYTLNSSQPFASGTLYNMAELPKNYLSNMDNAKLLKQINNCFNDNSYNNINIGPVVMAAPMSGSTKHKQKLNKSFENILASNKYNLRHAEGGATLKQAKQKNLSSSPRRGSSSGKKSGSIKSSSQLNKKKYLDQSYNLNSKNQQKALQNMKDFNYYIKTIEKDQQVEKYKLGNLNSFNLKDFNSMPTTPTSILKKVEDQVKALASQNYNSTQVANPLSKADVKAQMSNTCPNIAQVLSQLDSYGAGAPSQGYPLSGNLAKSNNKVPLIQNLKSQANESLISNTHTPQHIQNPTVGFGATAGAPAISSLIMAQSQNSLSGQSLVSNLANQQMDKQFTFSKTQKIDIKEATKNLFTYQKPREGQTARELSNENKRLKQSIGAGGLGSLLVDEASKIKAMKGGANTKRSRGSQEKYLTHNFQGTQGIAGGQILVNNGSTGSASHAKLNKSLNNIGQGNSGAQNSKKKDSLSKSMINNFVKGANMSPKDKKLVHSMLKNQLMGGGTNSAIATVAQAQPSHQGQTHGQANPLNNQYSYSSNLLYDYIQNTEHTKKGGTHQANARTPVKRQPQIKKGGVTGKVGSQYSEIFEISPSSGEKDLTQNQRQQYAKYMML